jgi:hypothetical protein
MIYSVSRHAQELVHACKSIAEDDLEKRFE